MVATPAIVFGISVTLFMVWALITNIEQRRGNRFFLGGLRGWLDRQLARLARSLWHGLDYVSRRVITFTWYYSLHSFIRGVLALLERAYIYLERRMRLHHSKATAARSERPVGSSVLSEIADHKEATALTEKQKQKRKEESLKG